jgi:hypothetical protein
MRKDLIIENLIKKIKKEIISERKSDTLSLYISRLIIKQFKKKEDFEFDNLYFERGDEYATFDLTCSFIEDEDLNEPFSIHAEADMQEMEIEITYNPREFPKSMNDFVAEVRETVEHELEHIEQQNFEDMEVYNDEDDDDEEKDDNFKYLTSNKEIPAYVRGLIRRAKTKKISLSDAMDEWFNENKKKFENPKEEWSIVKKIWMDFAKEMRSKEKIKKFK